MADYRSGGVNSSTERIVYSMLAEMHCVKPGKIEVFDSETNLAEVRPVVKIKTTVNKEPVYQELPVLVRVPVVIPYSPMAGLCITQPIRNGDPCLLLFADTMLDNFVARFEKSGCCVAPESNGGNNRTSIPRIHDLTDCVCIPGMHGVKDAIPHWNSDAVELRNFDRTAFISLAKSGDIAVKTTGNIDIAADGIITINGKEVFIN